MWVVKSKGAIVFECYTHFTQCKDIIFLPYCAIGMLIHCIKMLRASMMQTLREVIVYLTHVISWELIYTYRLLPRGELHIMSTIAG